MALGLLAGPVAGDTSGPIAGWNGSIFEDVKTLPLSDTDFFNTDWGMHVTYAFTNYAGFLFELQYDADEMTNITFRPAGPHAGLEHSRQYLVRSILDYNDGTPNWGTPPAWIAAWASDATVSGIPVGTSELIPLFNVTGHATNTTPLNNSDIDVTLPEVWQILHIVNTGTYQVKAGDWIYKDRFQIDFKATPGLGRWWQQAVTTTVEIPASFFVATNDFIQNAAGLGIEHIPTPGAWALIASGLGLGALARRRRRA
jgi:hypothetical protein